MWPYLKVSYTVWAPLVVGFAYVVSQFICELLGKGPDYAFQRSGSILVCASLWATIAMTRWWATKKLDEDGLVFSPFGDEVSQENVKFLVEAGNINIATTGFHLKKLQTWLKRTNYLAGLMGTVIWGYGDLLF